MRLFQVDAFTNERFTGNPAAVCLLDVAHDNRWMQAVAEEMNLSETAFLVPGDERFNLRWFTPSVEVDLCGHATLASAHVLWETEVADPDEPIEFDTLSGMLSAVRRDDWIEMDFPATPEQAADCNIDLERAVLRTFSQSGMREGAYSFWQHMVVERFYEGDIDGACRRIDGIEDAVLKGAVQSLVADMAYAVRSASAA